MIRADIGNETDGRMDDFAKARRLPSMIDSHFNHSRLMSGGEPEQVWGTPIRLLKLPSVFSVRHR